MCRHVSPFRMRRIVIGATPKRRAISTVFSLASRMALTVSLFSFAWLLASPGAAWIGRPFAQASSRLDVSVIC